MRGLRFIARFLTDNRLVSLLLNPGERDETRVARSDVEGSRHRHLRRFRLRLATLRRRRISLLLSVRRDVRALLGSC